MKHWILMIIAVICVLGIEAIVCYWAYMAHWSLGVLVTCVVILLNILAYIKDEY